MQRTIVSLCLLAATTVLLGGRPIEAQSHQFSLESPGGGAVNIGTTGESNLQVRAAGSSMNFLVDVDQDTADTTQHLFTWYVNNYAEGSRLMQLTARQPFDDGTLRVAGSVIANGFDLAESFWTDASVEPGSVVALAVPRSDAVRKSARAYESLVLGVASKNPGALLGGAAFSIDQLRENWGDQAVELFRRERPEIELQLLRANPDLEADRAILAAATDMPDEMLLEKQRSHEERLFDRVMRRFLDRHLVSVALAGRVPVRADAGFGPIEPGDPLTASPVPGVAMKADRPGPVLGFALEGLAAGQAEILLFVDRGWSQGSSGIELATWERLLEEKDREIARVQRAGERAVEAYAAEVTAFRRELRVLRSELAEVRTASCRDDREPAGQPIAKVAALVRDRIE